MCKFDITIRKMILYVFFHICLHFMYITQSHASHQNELQMIVDLIKSYDKATSVVAYLCWKPSEQTELMKRLMEPENPLLIQFVNKTWIHSNPKFVERLLVISDLNCPSAEEFLKMANSTNKYAFPYRWLIIGNHANESHTVISSKIFDLQLLADSNVVISQKNENSSFTLTSVYKMHKNSFWRMEYIGTWALNQGFKKSKLADISIAIRRRNFNGEPLKSVLVALDNKTREDPSDLRDLITDTVTKSSYRSTDPIYEYLNASKQLIFTDTWGYYKDGKFSGMVGELTAGEAELANTFIFVTKERMPILDYLYSPTTSNIKFVFREPPLSYQNNLFLLPFKTSVWCCTGIFMIILAVIIYINALWEAKKVISDKDQDSNPTSLKPSIGDIAMLVISAVSQQGSFIELKGTLGRVVMFLLFFAFLLLYSAYSASIVALLQSTSNQIRTLSDLLESKLEVGVEDTPYNRYYFPIATEPVRKALYETKVAPPGKKPNYMNLEQGVKSLQNKPFAFYMYTGVGYRLIEKFFYEHEKCGLQEISYLSHTTTYIACRKRSSYLEILKIGFFKIKEHGLSERENRLTFGRKPSCTSRGGSFGSVNMVDFHPVLLMYFYGIILAFLFLVLEILIHRKMNLISASE